MMHSDEVLLYAFRYVMGRSSHSVVDVADHIIECWPMLSEKTQDIIIKEIIDSLELDTAGDSVDQEVWMDVLANVDVEYLDRLNKKCFVEGGKRGGAGGF